MTSTDGVTPAPSPFFAAGKSSGKLFWEIYPANSPVNFAVQLPAEEPRAPRQTGAEAGHQQGVATIDATFLNGLIQSNRN